MSTIQHMILIGMKGSGTSILGRDLSGISKRRFIDIDESILRLYKLNNPTPQHNPILLHQLYDKVGHHVYQAYECLAIEQALKTFSNRRGILSIDSGTLFNSNHLSKLSKHGRFFYLKGSYELLLSRWLTIEPILNHIVDEANLFQDYYQMHDVFLKEIADIILDIDSLSPSECVDSLRICSQKQFWYTHLNSRGKKNKLSSIKIFKKSIVCSEIFDTDLDTDQKNHACFVK
jgi:shikimate kinase